MFKWRKDLDFVNQLIDWFTEASSETARAQENRLIGKIEGAIFGKTGKEVRIDSLTDLCEALGIPYYHDCQTGLVYWGDKAKRTGKTK